MIDLLPALPSVWAEGVVRGLRARGGFEVAMQWSEGRLREATIRSTTGRHVRVRYGEQVVDLVLTPGEAAELDGNLDRR